MFRLCHPRHAALPAALCAALTTVLATSGCDVGPPAKAPRAPVLLITIDTLPAPRVACYGAPDVRTPEIDRLARRGAQIPDAVSPVPLTLPTHTTLLTGLDPTVHGVRENGLFVLNPAQQTVPELLPDDVATAAFVGAFPLASRFGLDQGFDLYDDRFPARTGARVRHQPMRRAREVLDPAAEWLTGPDAGRRPFVWAHLFDPHYPYEAPVPWPRAAEELGGGAYEAEVSYADRELGRFLRRIGASERGSDATIVLAADHGESLGKHKELTHGLFIYDATQRVPLILVAPDVTPRVETTQRPLLDVAPTLLAAYGVRPPRELAGTPLQSPAPARPAYVETKHTELMRGWSPLYGIRTDRWKYVRAPRPELYDLRVDPGEAANRIGDHPDVTARLAALLDGILARQSEAVPSGMDEEVAEKLHALGYVATAEPGGAGDPNIDPKDRVDSAAALFRGQEAYLLGNLPAAERHLRRAVQLDPDAKEAHSFLAGTYYGLRSYSAAIEHAERALELPPHLNEAPVHVTLAEAFLALGRPADAVPHQRQALAVKPGDEKAQRLLRQAEAAAR